MATVSRLWCFETENSVLCARVIPGAPPLTTTHSNTSASIFPLRFPCSPALFLKQEPFQACMRVYVSRGVTGVFLFARICSVDLTFIFHMASVVTGAHEMPCVSPVLLLSHGFGWDFAGCNIPWHSQGVIRLHDLSPFMLFFKGNCSFFFTQPIFYHRNPDLLCDAV